MTRRASITPPRGTGRAGRRGVAVAADAATRPTKFDSTRSPASDDFSGWNCRPYSEPLATALTNGRPCVVRATTTLSSAGAGANECTK